MHRSTPYAKLRALGLAGAVALAVFSGSVDARGQGASIDSATAEQKAAAQKSFEDGMKAAKAKKHEEALTAYKASYDAVASPNSHLMICRELVELGRLEEAYLEYEKTLAEAEAAAAKDKKYEGSATSAKTELGELKNRLGFLKLNVTGAGEGARITVRGREIPESDWGKPIPAQPGQTRIELVLRDGKETVKEVTAKAGVETLVDLAPGAASAGTEPDTAKAQGSAELSTSGGKPSMRTAAYVAGGVGIAGLATFTIFGIMNNSKHSKLEDECAGNTCPSSLEDDKKAGQRYQTIANIGLAVGIVGLGTGTVLFLMSRKKSEKTATVAPKQRPRVDQVSLGYRSVLVTGSF